MSKTKLLIIGVICLSVAIGGVLAFSLQEKTNNQNMPNGSQTDNDSTSDYSSGISAEFSPSVYDGINRDTNKYAINITHDDLVDVPKIKTMLDLALDIPVPIGQNTPIREGIVISDDTSKYYLVQTGPFSIKVENYMSDEELIKYQSWADENLESIPIYNEVPRYYVSYNGEVFTIKFNNSSMVNQK